MCVCVCVCVCGDWCVQVPSSYVALQRRISEEVVKCHENEIPPVLNQKEFAALAESIENNDILDPEELSLGKCMGIGWPGMLRAIEFCCSTTSNIASSRSSLGY